MHERPQYRHRRPPHHVATCRDVISRYPIQNTGQLAGRLSRRSYGCFSTASLAAMTGWERNFSAEKYALIVTELRDRLLSAEVLSNEKSLVFVESTALQIRKILELIAYLSVLVNADKLNHKERAEYHAGKIVDSLDEKTTIHYPFPSRMIHPSRPDDQPVLIPLGYKNALSQSEFKKTYQSCGKVLHAQHPLKQKGDPHELFLNHKRTLGRLKGLLERHTIGIRRAANMYTFLHVEIDFSNDENTRESTIREYNTRIFSEQQLLQIFATR